MSNELGKLLKQKRINMPLTLQELAVTSGVSSSHIGRIERGERQPSARVLRQLAAPLGFNEQDLFTVAGFLTSKDVPGQPALTIGGNQVEPFVAAILSKEPPAMQYAVVGILSLLKTIAEHIKK